ncbi:MAG: class I SAM-dependent methyltransferase [Reichenbachiella sp.]
MKDIIKASYERIAKRYNELIDHKPHNAYYDRPNTLKLLGDVAGKIILDAACGPGKYAEILHEKGAKVIGFDLSPEMIKFAKSRNQDSGNFFVHDMSEPMSMLEDGSIDMVLYALAFHYVEDWAPTLREFHRVLRPNGRLVLSIEHPFFEYEYFKSTRYFDTEAVQCTWKGFGDPVDIHSYRRPLNQCISPLTQNGFYIDELVEPKPTEEFEKLDPKHFKELNAFPAFMCIAAVKKPTIGH